LLSPLSHLELSQKSHKRTSLYRLDFPFPVSTPSRPLSKTLRLDSPPSKIPFCDVSTSLRAQLSRLLKGSDFLSSSPPLCPPPSPPFYPLKFSSPIASPHPITLPATLSSPPLLAFGSCEAVPSPVAICHSADPTRPSYRSVLSH
jgi:hypothetical protein